MWGSSLSIVSSHKKTACDPDQIFSTRDRVPDRQTGAILPLWMGPWFYTASLELQDYRRQPHFNLSTFQHHDVKNPCIESNPKCTDQYHNTFSQRRMVRREKRVNKLKGIYDIHSRLHYRLTPLPTPSLQRSTTVFWTLTWHHYLVSIPEGKRGVSTNKPTSTYLGSTLHT